MTWPTTDVNTTNTDSGTDNPQNARADILDLMQKFNQLRAHVSSFIQTLLDDTSQGAAQDTLGVHPTTSGTAIATTSGTSHDFTSIPSWVKKITVMFSGVNFSTSDTLLVQIGDSGGVETTGYGTRRIHIESTPAYAYSNGNAAGFDVCYGGGTRSGCITLVLLNASTNAWVCTGITYTQPSVTIVTHLYGSKALSGTLDRVRLTSVGGDTFASGTFNILYE